MEEISFGLLVGVGIPVVHIDRSISTRCSGVKSRLSLGCDCHNEKCLLVPRKGLGEVSNRGRRTAFYFTIFLILEHGYRISSIKIGPTI